jgi:alkanesulfonate monooxygenase SsuD/methylene tetrahydromethanopterin reductase-like flavin-dependent oxidoreductase (luciferase family)
MILGVGMGGNREEFEMLYPRQSKGHRGQMLDEFLEILKLLFNKSIASYTGTYYEFHDVILEPKPLQKPFPIYISGNTPKTIERAVKFCSGLMMYSPTVAEMRQQADKLKAVANEHGRDPSGFETVISTTLSIGRTKEEAIRRFETSHTARREGVGSDIDVTISRNLIGTSEDLIERIVELEVAGLKHCAIPGVVADSIDERIEQWEMFASEVMPTFKKKLS